MKLDSQKNNLMDGQIRGEKSSKQWDDRAASGRMND
jgi:hypothetical protein